MKTLLVIGRNPEFVAEIRAALPPDVYQVVSHADIGDAEALLLHGVVDVCIFDLEEFPEKTLSRVDALRKLFPDCPVVVYIREADAELEKEAYLRGARHVLRKPVHPQVLNSVLGQLIGTAKGGELPLATGPPPRLPESRPMGIPSVEKQRGLIYLRECARILAVSLSRNEMLKRFLEIIRVLTGINRAAIFLRQPVVGSHRPHGSLDFKFRPVCGFGLPGLEGHQVEVSLASGICRMLYKTGQVLQVGTAPPTLDLDVQREFETLGVDVAVPIFEFDTLLGVLLLGRKITGQPLTEEEVQEIFFAVEHLGHAIRHSWQHDQLVVNHRILADLIRELDVACIVVGRDYRIIQLNKAAKKLLAKQVARVTQVVFDDLPEVIAQRTREVLNTGRAIDGFKFEPADAPETVFQVSILPMPISDSETAALIIGEDLSRVEKIKRLEIEASNWRLIREMAERSVHDIGNALVPLLTHQEMLRSKARDPQFIASLDSALQESLRRITRRLDQLRYLARDELGELASFSVGILLQEAFEEARVHTGAENAQLVVGELHEAEILCDKVALKRAFCELFMNAIQANIANPVVGLSVVARSDEQNRPGLLIEIQDTGPGFTTEEAARAGTAFWTRRAVGMGLGLAVARKIFALHNGRLEIHPAWEKPGGRVSVWLPQSGPRQKRGVA